MKKVSILGCGNGGMALAADLKLKGTAVALWADSMHSTKLEAILKNNKEVTLREENQTQTVQLDLVTTDLSAVIKFGDIIYICAPMDIHVNLFKEIASILKNNSDIKILINLSGVFSGIDQYLNSEDKDIFQFLKVFDSSTFPYACRAGKDNNVYILGRKFILPIAPLFRKDQGMLIHIPDYVKPISFHVVENIFKLGLMGNNAVLHPATVLFNVNSIDKAHSFQFYKEGNTQKTALLHEAIDRERLLLAETMGYRLKNNIGILNQMYGTYFKNHADLFENFSVYAKVKAPATLNHRFLTEDAAFSLVPLLALARLYQVELPNIKSMVQIFSTIMEINYLENGRNLSGLTIEIIESLSKPEQKQQDGITIAKPMNSGLSLRKIDEVIKENQPKYFVSNNSLFNIREKNSNNSQNSSENIGKQIFIKSCL